LKNSFRFLPVFSGSMPPVRFLVRSVMRNFVLAACFAVSFSCLATGPTMAFGDGCGDHAIECYDKVRLPDVYATRTRSVLLQPGYRIIVPTPPIVRNYAVPVVMRPGRWRTVVSAPVYGVRRQRVLVAPAHRTYEEIPAVTRRVEQTVVARGGVHWQHRRGLFDRERLCKIATPPETRTVVREVVVSPARRISHVSPAVYENVAQPVLLRPATAARVYEPPVHGYINRSAVVRPASVMVFAHPPVVGITRENVLVRPGGYAWARSRPGFFSRW
jgi:hypothetical protein